MGRTKEIDMFPLTDKMQWLYFHELTGTKNGNMTIIHSTRVMWRAPYYWYEKVDYNLIYMIL